MKMKRKALAFLLTLCMLFVLIPAQPAAADESDGTLRALNEEKTFYAMDYRYDYQMSELLTHNIHDSNDLVKWVVSHLISSNKDLSYSINMGDGGACSAFVAQDNNDNILYARNYDYLQSAKNVLMHTYSKDGYEAIAMAAGGWIDIDGVDLSDNPLLMALPYLAMDGMNEKGMMISVLKLDGEGAQPEDSSLIPNLFVRLVLDYAANVQEAIDLLHDYNIRTSMTYSNFHFFVADKTGEYGIIEVTPGKGDVSIQYDSLNDSYSTKGGRQITNFYQLYPSQDENLDDGLHGFDRYMRFIRHLSDCDYTMSKEAAMALLSEAYQDNTIDATHETQWSVVYSPADMTASVSVRTNASDDKDTFYTTQYDFDLSLLGSGENQTFVFNPVVSSLTPQSANADTGIYGEGERTFNVISHTQTTYAGGQVISELEISDINGDWNEKQIIQTLKDAGIQSDLYKISYSTNDQTAVVTFSKSTARSTESAHFGTTEFVTFDGTLQGLITAIDADDCDQMMIQAQGDIRVPADTNGGDTASITGSGQSVVLEMNGHRLYNDDGSSDFSISLKNLHLAINMDTSLVDAGISQINLDDHGYIVCNADASDGLTAITSNWDDALIGYGTWKNVGEISVDKIIGGYFYNTEDGKETLLDVNTITGGTFGRRNSQNNIQYPLIISGDVLSGTFMGEPIVEIINGGTIQSGTYHGEVVLYQGEIVKGDFRNTVIAQYNEDIYNGSSLGESLISGGVFRSNVINRGVISNGVFLNTVENDLASDTDYDGDAISDGLGGEITGGVFSDKNNLTGSKSLDLTFQKLTLDDAKIVGTDLTTADVISGTSPVRINAITHPKYVFYQWVCETDKVDTILYPPMDDITSLTMPDHDLTLRADRRTEQQADYKIALSRSAYGFGVVPEGMPIEPITGYLKNVGLKDITDWEIKSATIATVYTIELENDNAENILLRDHTYKFTITPKQNLTKDIYNEHLHFYAYDAEHNTVLDQDFYIDLHIPEYKLTSDTSVLNFGSHDEGYTQPAAKTFTITSTGNAGIYNWKLTSDAASSAYIISPDSGDYLEPWMGAETITVQPKEGLPAGTYNETLTIQGDESNIVSIQVKFEVKSSISCEGQKEISLSEGNHQMTIGGTDVGTYTFAKSSSDKWSIQNADGKYIGFKNNALTLNDEPFYWTFKNHMFYTTVTEKQSSGWGWGWWNREQTTTVNWFLIAGSNGLTVSKSESAAKAAFYDTVASKEHSFGKWSSDGSGTHARTCEVCGFTENGNCSYDPDTHKCTICGAADPAHASVHVEVNVTKITGSNGGGWWFWSKPSTTTTWTASITATGEGVDISKVEYSTDQTNYKTGTSFTSKSEIKTFYIRVTDSNGNITNWIYENGTTRQL